MQEQYADGLVTISWNLDHNDPTRPPSEELQQSVLDKLSSMGVTSHNVISADPMDTVLQHYGIFGLPAALVYAKDGTLAKRFEGVFTYEGDVGPLVAELLRR